ncbi:SEFIR domain-containing protein [Streptomyces sp. NPDC021224]|uniref:SEFIR domain-containing protein n=1 Tax=unclassified Streptomyces TaxID=2593676 RepID=UPI00379F6FCD
MRIDLTLVREGGRRMDSAPGDAVFGAVRLWNWQVDRIEPPVHTFGGSDLHLIKINYELELRPGFSRMPWFEISCRFPSPEGEGQAVVVDALPGRVAPTDVSRAYVLNQYLNFVPSADGAGAHAFLPASADRIDTFGIGGPGVRWRHVEHGESGVRQGSYAAWAVLLTPGGRVEQEVEFSVRYDRSAGPDDAYVPVQSPASFVLDLGERAAPVPAVTPWPSAANGERAGRRAPSVFICYAHDSPHHKYMARQFGTLLVKSGVDAHMDQWDDDGRKEWSVWALKLINEVDYVVVLASPICRKAFDGGLHGPDHPGIRSEAQLIKEKLHAHRDVWTAKVLPVVLPHESVDNIPEILQPWTTDHYEVEKLTSDGINDLLRAMTGVPRYSRPTLGTLPPDVVDPLEDDEF